MSNVKVKMKINTDEIANVIEVTENSIRISNRNQQNANPNPSIQSQKKTRFIDSSRKLQTTYVTTNNIQTTSTLTR